LKFYIETYGCQMNISDSELISTILTDAGHTPVISIDEAELFIFNTCSVRQHAEDRVLGRISNEKVRKQSNPDLKIAVVGCMAQRLGDSLLKPGSGIDIVIGVDQYTHLPELIEGQIGLSHNTRMNSDEVYHQLVPTHQNPHCAFITIMRGCNNFCTYCIVPHVRGRERSRPHEEILVDFEEALRSGHRDITLLGQNVNSYNDGYVDFPGLMELLANREDKFRLRYITSHPKDLSDSLIDVMVKYPNISRHIHLPLQSGDDEILKRMNRHYDLARYLSIIEKLRNAMPDIAITTDLIAGFPGESRDQFENTLRVMQQVRFDYAFCFKYSNREGTSAAGFPDQVDEAERLARLQQMIDLQRDITLEKFQAKIGSVVDIYVESLSKKSELDVSGKTDDYKIAVVKGEAGMIGSFVQARVVTATAGTLICEPIIDN